MVWGEWAGAGCRRLVGKLRNSFQCLVPVVWLLDRECTWVVPLGCCRSCALVGSARHVCTALVAAAALLGPWGPSYCPASPQCRRRGPERCSATAAAQGWMCGAGTAAPICPPACGAGGVLQTGASLGSCAAGPRRAVQYARARQNRCARCERDAVHNERLWTRRVTGYAWGTTGRPRPPRAGGSGVNLGWQRGRVGSGHTGHGARAPGTGPGIQDSLPHTEHAERQAEREADKRSRVHRGAKQCTAPECVQLKRGKETGRGIHERGGREKKNKDGSHKTATSAQ